MKELSLEEIKQKELQLVQLFDDSCKKNGWRYSLGGGSLLGAVRHNGFIPWDDDIDVIMPRPDYDNMVEKSKKNDLGFDVFTHETVNGYNNLHGKISLRGTRIVDNTINLDEYDMGIHVDIFPIEGLGRDYSEAKKTFNKTTLRRELLNARTWKKYSKSKTHSIIYEPVRLILFLASRIVTAEQLLKSIDKFNRKKSFEKENYCGCVSGCYRVKEILKQNVFLSYCEMPFESIQLQCLSNYDLYLKSLYGDYMKLPPIEKQISHHTFKAFSIEGEK